MRVLQINVCYGYASTGRTTKELAEALDSKGIENYVAYYDAIKPREKDYKIGNVVDEKFHAVCSRVFGLQGYFSHFSTLNLIRYIKKIKPDIVHLRVLHSNFINIYKLMDFLAKNKIATVLTLHDCFYFTGKCCHYTLDKCYKWQDKCGNCPRLKKDNKSLFFDRTAKMLKDKSTAFSKLDKLAVVGVSDWITNEAKQSILKNAKIIAREYEWIDLDVFKPQHSSFRQDNNLENKFIILGVATNWNNSKGIDRIMQVARTHGDATVVIVGNVQKPLEPLQNVIHVKNTDNVNELVDIYNAADVFVNPSMEETFGKVTAEALACGLPVIVMNSTASPELVSDGCGYIAKNNTIEEIIEGINLVKQKGKSYYTKKCRDFALQNFDKETNINQQIDIYKELLE